MKGNQLSDELIEKLISELTNNELKELINEISGRKKLLKMKF